MINNKRITISLLAIACSVGLTACGDKKEMSAYDQGVEALKVQDYARAGELFKQAEAKGERLQLVYRGEGMSYLGLGMYDDSILCFEKALNESNGLIKSVDFDANYYLASAFYKKGDLQNAYDAYTAIIDLSEKESNACYLRGKISLDRGELEAAKADFDKGLSVDRTGPSSYIFIYKELVAHGYEAEGKSYINLALKNLNKLGNYELGLFNFYLGDYTQARNYFEESKEIRSSEEGIIYLGKTYAALGDEGYAISLYESYITGDTNGSEIYNELGNLKFKKKDYEGALASFEVGLKSTNTSCRQNLLFNRIVCYEFLEDYKTAASLMKEYVEAYPDDDIAARENVFLSTR